MLLIDFMKTLRKCEWTNFASRLPQSAHNAHPFKRISEQLLFLLSLLLLAQGLGTATELPVRVKWQIKPLVLRKASIANCTTCVSVGSPHHHFY